MTRIQKIVTEKETFLSKLDAQRQIVCKNGTMTNKENIFKRNITHIINIDILNLKMSYKNNVPVVKVFAA